MRSPGLGYGFAVLPMQVFLVPGVARYPQV